jgi:hypothetical protein
VTEIGMHFVTGLSPYDICIDEYGNTACGSKQLTDATFSSPHSAVVHAANFKSAMA